MVFLKEFFNKVDFEKNQQATKNREKFPRGQRVKYGTFLKSERIIKAILENPKAASKFAFCKYVSF